MLCVGQVSPLLVLFILYHNNLCPPPPSAPVYDESTVSQSPTLMYKYFTVYSQVLTFNIINV